MSFKNPTRDNDVVSYTSSSESSSPLRKYLETLPELLITMGRRRVETLLVVVGRTSSSSSSLETAFCWTSMEVLRDDLWEDNFLGRVKIGYWVGVDLDGLRKRRELGFGFRDECIG